MMVSVSRYCNIRVSSSVLFLEMIDGPCCTSGLHSAVEQVGYKGNE